MVFKPRTSYTIIITNLLSVGKNDKTYKCPYNKFDIEFTTVYKLDRYKNSLVKFLNFFDENTKMLQSFSHLLEVDPKTL